jgi:hypothetical protein
LVCYQLRSLSEIHDAYGCLCLAPLTHNAQSFTAGTITWWWDGVPQPRAMGAEREGELRRQVGGKTSECRDFHLGCCYTIPYVGEIRVQRYCFGVWRAVERCGSVSVRAVL